MTKRDSFSFQGLGVFTTRSFSQHDFLLTYHGKLLSKMEGEKKNITYKKEEEKTGKKIGNFLYYFEDVRDNGRKRNLW